MINILNALNQYFHIPIIRAFKTNIHFLSLLDFMTSFIYLSYLFDLEGIFLVKRF